MAALHRDGFALRANAGKQGFGRQSCPDDGRDATRVLQRAIVLAKEGDRDAVHYLYVRYADSVYGYIRSIVRDEHEAEDLTHHVFAKLMKSIHKYEPRDVPFSAWILRVARNVALDHKRQARSVPVEEVRSSSDADDNGNHQRVRCLKEALSCLPEDQREVLVLRHVLGLSPGEIAERLDKSEGSIHGLHHRGRAALKLALVELEAGPVTAGG